MSDTADDLIQDPHTEKQTMDEPQEEFIDSSARPSRPVQHQEGRVPASQHQQPEA